MDTFNNFMVSVQGNSIVILRPPTKLTKEQALAFAAWIVAMADPGGEEFAKVLTEICNS